MALRARGLAATSSAPGLMRAIDLLARVEATLEAEAQAYGFSRTH